MHGNFTIHFHPLKESDLPLLTDWLNRSHLQKWWRNEKVTVDAVREKYLPRIHQKDSARPFVVTLNTSPIGYIQYYDASEGDPDWWPDEPGEGVYGIDQFIGDEERLNQGVGTAMIKEFIKFLQKQMRVNEIRMDPHPHNHRAIRCYEKAGFKQVQEITTPDGPALMMILEI